MATNTNSNTLAFSPNVMTARFGSVYGYRFNGDTVELHASFEGLNEDARALSWSLQLRAGSTSGSSISHLIAEVELPELAKFNGSGEPFYLTCPATPPAGNFEFNLSLVLVAHAPGLPDAVADVAYFERFEHFVLPRFLGEVRSIPAAEGMRLEIAAIENPRGPENLSGTLALELWALTEPYVGGKFHGTALTGETMGHLAGGQQWNGLSYVLKFEPSTVGRAHLVLMLREWTGAGYTTRDYCRIENPPFTREPEPIEQEVALQAPKAVKLEVQLPNTQEPAATAHPVPSAIKRVLTPNNAGARSGKIAAKAGKAAKAGASAKPTKKSRSKR